jgi:hypothetical protein
MNVLDTWSLALLRLAGLRACGLAGLSLFLETFLLSASVHEILESSAFQICV